MLFHFLITPNLKLFILTVLLILFFNSNHTLGQTAAQRETIIQSMSKEDSLKVSVEIENYSQARKDRVNKFLEENPFEKRHFQKNGQTYLLFDISSNGKPRYLTLKRVTRKNKRTCKKS